MRYLRMLSNSVIAAGVASGYLITLFLQLNPSVSIEPTTLLPLATVLAIAYGANLTVLFYALIVLREILDRETRDRMFVGATLVSAAGIAFLILGLAHLGRRGGQVSATLLSITIVLSVATPVI